MSLQTLANTDLLTILAAAAPIVAVPIGAMTFYLRSLRDQQSAAREESNRRIELTDAALQALHVQLANAESRAASKEDWLRESMLARSAIARLTESNAALRAAVDILLSRPIQNPFAANESPTPENHPTPQNQTTKSHYERNTTR
jgi:hypothetical protein